MIIDCGDAILFVIYDWVENFSLFSIFSIYSLKNVSLWIREKQEMDALRISRISFLLLLTIRKSTDSIRNISFWLECWNLRFKGANYWNRADQMKYSWSAGVKLKSFASCSWFAGKLTIISVIWLPALNHNRFISYWTVLHTVLHTQSLC